MVHIITWILKHAYLILISSYSLNRNVIFSFADKCRAFFYLFVPALTLFHYYLHSSDSKILCSNFHALKFEIYILHTCLYLSSKSEGEIFNNRDMWCIYLSMWPLHWLELYLDNFPSIFNNFLHHATNTISSYHHHTKESISIHQTLQNQSFSQHIKDTNLHMKFNR